MGLKPDVKAALGRLGLLKESGRRKTKQQRTKRQRCARRQKRGKRAGRLARLRANNRPTLPTLFLSNVRSLDNKIDPFRLRLNFHKEMRNCCAFLLTETWLNDNMPDSVHHLDGLLYFLADRDQLSGKSRGGGLCAYINRNWCTNCILVSQHCSNSVEFMSLKCHPHYQPQEFTVVLLVIVYIPPSTHAGTALMELHAHISGLQDKHPEAFW